MKKIITPESLYQLAIAEDPQISPAEDKIAFVIMRCNENNNDYQRSIWIVDLKGAKNPYLFSATDKDFCPRWSPDGTKIAFISARNGTPQVFIAPANGGEARKITQMVSGVSNICWSPDGTKIAFNCSATQAERDLEDAGVLYSQALKPFAADWSIKQRNALKDPREIKKLPYRTGTSFFDGQYKHVYVVAQDGSTLTRLSSGDFHHAAPCWNADSQSILSNTNRVQSSGDENFEIWSSILRFDVQSTQETVIAHEVSEEDRPTAISPDGKWLIYYQVSHSKSPYDEPYSIAICPNAPNSAGKTLLGIEETIVDFKWDYDSHHIFFIQHHHGNAKLICIDLDGNIQDEISPERGMMHQFSLSPARNLIAYTLSTPDLPSELYLYNRGTKTTVQLSHLNDSFIHSHFISDVNEFWFKSTDNVEVQGWFMRPANFEPTKTYPLCVEIHGGPQVMWGNAFWHEFQCIAARGYYVFFCNPRGSAGYGRNFQLIRGSGGYTDMPDIINGMKTVLSMEKSADPDKLAITGGSYGGYMTAWIIGHTNIFKAAVSQRGVYDKFNMFGSGDIPESTEWYHNGIPREETLHKLWEYSPISTAQNVTTPLLMLHSELDYRCPIGQAESYFAYLRRYKNRQVHMVRFPREGHELSRSGEPHHRVERLYRIVNWFDQMISHEKPFEKPLTADLMQQFLESNSDWELSNKQLIKRIYCGNQELALQVLNKVSSYANFKKRTINAVLNGNWVEIQISTQPLTLHEIYFAEWISALL